MADLDLSFAGFGAGGKAMTDIQGGSNGAYAAALLDPTGAPFDQVRWQALLRQPAMNVLLTGGTGFIGQPLTQALIAHGWNVVALVRKANSPPARALIKMGAQCVAGDITDRESMRAAMSGADIVVHNAGWYKLSVQ